MRSCNRVVQGMRKERSSARVLYFVYLYFFKGCLHLVETCVFLATCPLKDFFMWWVHTLENPFYRILRFKGGWAGQCSHRLEVFDPPTHPTSRREGVSPCHAIERCFAESPFVQKKKKERSFFSIIHSRCIFCDVLCGN